MLRNISQQVSAIQRHMKSCAKENFEQDLIVTQSDIRPAIIEV